MKHSAQLPCLRIRLRRHAGEHDMLPVIVAELGEENLERTALILTSAFTWPPWLPQSGARAEQQKLRQERTSNTPFFGDHSEPFVLSNAQAHQAVCGSLHLRRNFTYNSQAFCFSRALLSRLSTKGQVYLSPFPDYSLANVAIALSRSTIIEPAPLAIAGVSKASFGFTLFNGLEGLGASMLNTKLREDPAYREIEHKLLPGPAYQVNYAVTMQYVVRVTQDVLHERVDFGRHRRLQIVSALQHPNRGSSDEVWSDLRPRLSPFEGAWANAVESLMALRGSRRGCPDCRAGE
jgi:hypothetical protein